MPRKTKAQKAAEAAAEAERFAIMKAKHDAMVERIDAITAVPLFELSYDDFYWFVSRWAYPLGESARGKECREWKSQLMGDFRQAAHNRSLARLNLSPITGEEWKIEDERDDAYKLAYKIIVSQKIDWLNETIGPSMIAASEDTLAEARQRNRDYYRVKFGIAA